MRWPCDCLRVLIPVWLAVCVFGCTTTPVTSESPPDAHTHSGAAVSGDASSTLTPEAFIAEQQLADEDSGGSEGDVVCRTERPLGSHIRKRVCKSQAEMQKEAIEARHLIKTRQEVTRQ